MISARMLIHRRDYQMALLQIYVEIPSAAMITVSQEAVDVTSGTLFLFGQANYCLLGC